MEREKNQVNIKKHGIDFRDAFLIFNSPIITKIDNRFAYKEKRWIGIGKLRNLVVIFVYTKRGKNIRIISIRKANKVERNIYNEKFK